MTDGAGEVVGDREAAFFLAIKTRDEALLRALVDGDAALLLLLGGDGAPTMYADAGT